MIPLSVCPGVIALFFDVLARCLSDVCLQCPDVWTLFSESG